VQCHDVPFVVIGETFPRFEKELWGIGNEPGLCGRPGSPRVVAR